MAIELFDRRRRLLLGAGLAACSPLAAVSALLPTPRQTAGPFYPVTLPLDDDNDLTRVAGQPGPAEGEVTDLGGRVLDTSGRAIRGARLEIWQCDARGRYLHPGDRRGRSRDDRFQGHGHTLTDDAGYYRFRTIRPVPYPGRTPHIHAALFLPGQQPFITQIYVKDEPRNRDDFLFNRVPADRRHLLLAEFSPVTADGDRRFQAVFDLVVGATPYQS